MTTTATRFTGLLDNAKARMTTAEYLDLLLELSSLASAEHMESSGYAAQQDGGWGAAFNADAGCELVAA